MTDGPAPLISAIFRVIIVYCLVYYNQSDIERKIKDFKLKIKPYCDKECILKSKNKSKRPKIEELTKEEHELVQKYVNSRYKDDIEYYNQKCLN